MERREANGAQFAEGCETGVAGGGDGCASLGFGLAATFLVPQRPRPLELLQPRDALSRRLLPPVLVLGWRVRLLHQHITLFGHAALPDLGHRVAAISCCYDARYSAARNGNSRYIRLLHVAWQIVRSISNC